MPTIPANAKQPTDHKAPLTAVLDDDELLKDLPDLTPPTKLRIRQKNKIMKMAIALRKFFPEAAEDDETAEINTEDMDDETLAAMLDVFADVDDFAESIADDPAAYIAWSEKAGYEHFSALLMCYSSAVGESTSSSN